jgi:ABC-type protease/lipase transport system fused ATPase/permease subunit
MRTSGEIENREAFRRLIGGIKRGYALAFIASIGLNVLALVTPVYMSQIYDRVLLTGSIDTLLFLTVICAVALAVLGALDALRSAILSRIGAWFERTLRFELLSAVLRIAFERGNTAGQQMLNDLQAVKTYIGSVQIAALLDGPWVPVFMGVIWLIHPWLGGCATLSALLLFGIAIATDRLTTKRI